MKLYVSSLIVLIAMGVIGIVEYAQAESPEPPEIVADLVIDEPCSNSFKIIGNHDITHEGQIDVEFTLNNNRVAYHNFIDTNNTNSFELEYNFNMPHGVRVNGGLYLIFHEWIIGTYDIRITMKETHPIHIANREKYTNFDIERQLYVTNSTETNQLCFNLKEHLNGETPETTTIPKTRLQLANEKIETLETQLNDLQIRYNNLQSQPRSNPTKLTDLQIRYNTLETQYNDLQTQHNTLQTKTDDLMNKVNTKSDTKNTWKERYKICFDKKEILKTKIENTTQELNQCKADKTTLESELNQYKLDIVYNKNQCTQLLNDHETQITTLQGNITEYKFTIEKLKQEKADLIKQVEELEANNQDLQQRLDDLEN